MQLQARCSSVTIIRNDRTVEGKAECSAYFETAEPIGSPEYGTQPAAVVNVRITLEQAEALVQGRLYSITLAPVDEA